MVASGSSWHSAGCVGPNPAADIVAAASSGSSWHTVRRVGSSLAAHAFLHLSAALIRRLQLSFEAIIAAGHASRLFRHRRRSLAAFKSTQTMGCVTPWRLSWFSAL